MSEQRKTLLGTILAALLSIFIQNWPKLVEKLRGKIPAEIDEKVQWVIEIVQRIKNSEPEEGVDFIEAVIPGTGELIDQARTWLRNILASYGLTDIPGPELKRGQLKLISDELTAELTGTPYGQASLTNQVVYTDTYEKELPLYEG